ncbi:hypothetical protein GO730_28375 [Spirosoma sp. HMF3257]|uniref:Uncharacterized protein n=1 Tax=Spirosoma telluris TaxID=2183553 RepID=A0A327NPL9_9BACT|nr:hypothetical protein [Spirosoma telluris]RAI77117.1 hypothetical protein HMF3257_28315 [Spirosoma telluris]
MTKTSTRILLAWLFISLVGVVSPALAQSQQPPTQLTERDKQNINAAALKSLNRLNVLLNALAVEGLEDAEVDTIIKKSYSGPARIFDNVNVSIEDDINPEHTSATKTEDLKVDEYLNRLSLYYSKRSPNDDKVTIIFPKQEATAAQQNGSSTYIKVFFESVFKGKYIPKSSSYQPASRVIELRAEKPGQYWRVYITRFSFKQPGEGMQQVVGTGRPTIPPGIKVGGAEIPYRKTGTEQLVVLKFTTQWLEVVNSQETDLPTGIYKRKIKETGQISEAQVYDFDNTRAIELKENSNRFSFRNDITTTWFDRVNPIINKPTAPKSRLFHSPIRPGKLQVKDQR